MIQVDTSAFQAEPIGTHEGLVRVEAVFAKTDAEVTPEDHEEYLG